MMREVQTEPKLQVTVSSLGFAIHIVRLYVRNVGLGPALNRDFPLATWLRGENGFDRPRKLEGFGSIP